MRPIKLTTSITNRTAILDKYLNELSGLSLITTEEEADLCKRIKLGDEAALQKLVKANLKFVVSVAKKYDTGAHGLEDLINEGNLGLIRAARSFDATRGFKFISYAVWWIRQAILQYIADKHRMIRLPANQINALATLKKASGQLEQELERPPTFDELEAFTEISLDKIKDYMSSAPHTYSLDRVVNNEEGKSLLDTVADTETEATDDVLIKESGSIAVLKAVEGLPPKCSQVLQLYYGLNGHEPHDMETIALVMGMGKERIRQLRVIGIKHLRIKKTDLKEYFNDIG